MRFQALTTFLAASSVVFGVSAGPLADKRDSSPSSSSTSSAATAALVVSTLSDGSKTTFQVAAPQATSTSGDSGSATTSADASATTSTDGAASSASATRTGASAPISTNFPVCHDADAAPFCLPNNESSLYIGNTYYVTWNPDFFPVNTTVTVKLQLVNDTAQEVWTSAQTDNSWGYVSITMTKDMLQGYSKYNLTFIALNFAADDPKEHATPYTGPTIQLQSAPSRHYEAPARTKSPNKLGLMIGLPVSLGFVLLVLIVLGVGMQKHRTIGLGNIMGRRNKGYGVGKSRRQRMGLGKKGAIRLQDHSSAATPQYTDAGHRRGDSLGSLVDDDEIRPAPGSNHFRDEVQRQRTGR